MATTPAADMSPIVLAAGDGEARLFLGTVATSNSSTETTAGRVAVIEHLAPQGSDSPLHVHHREDEWLYITAGAVTFWVGGHVTVASAGSFIFGPRGIPHTFTVTSDQARFMLVTAPAGFEGFLRALSVPAESLPLPPVSVDPPDPERMMAAAAEYGIEILGPPGIPASSQPVSPRLASGGGL